MLVGHVELGAIEKPVPLIEAATLRRSAVPLLVTVIVWFVAAVPKVRLEGVTEMPGVGTGVPTVKAWTQVLQLNWPLDF